MNIEYNACAQSIKSKHTAYHPQLIYFIVNWFRRNLCFWQMFNGKTVIRYFPWINCIQMEPLSKPLDQHPTSIHLMYDIRTALCHQIRSWKMERFFLPCCWNDAEFATSCDAYKFIWLHIINSLFRVPSFRKMAAIHIRRRCSAKWKGTIFFLLTFLIYDNNNNSQFFSIQCSVVQIFSFPVYYYLDTGDGACITCRIMYNIYILFSYSNFCRLAFHVLCLLSVCEFCILRIGMKFHGVSDKDQKWS